MTTTTRRYREPFRGLFAYRKAQGLLSFCLAAALTGSAWALPARVDQLRGEAEQRAAGAMDWEKLHIGDKVEEGASVRTGANSLLEVVTHRGHRLTVKSDSLVDLVNLQDDDTKARLEKGRVRSKVQHL